MSKIEYKNPLDVTVSKIFGIFHILSETNRFYSSEEPIELVLLILSMYKDGLISINSFNDPDSFNKFEETLELISKEPYRHVYYSEIVGFISIGLSRIGRQTYNRICNVLIDLDYEYLKENFTEIFDDVLYRTANADGRYTGENFQPVELTRLVSAIADLPSKAKVFNPFAGLASFGVNFGPGQIYYGQEDNLHTWKLGYMRLLAYERQIASKYVCVDSIYHWPGDSEKFDLVVTNPPQGLRFTDTYSKKYPDIRTIEQFLIQKSLNSLNEKGKLIALLPQKFLFDGLDKHLRKHLIEHDLLETVISLPGGLLLNTSIPLIIIVINKNNKTKGKVRFIDANKFVEVKSSRDKILKYNELFESIQDINHDSDFIRIIDKIKIKTNDYNLSVPRYFQKEIVLENNEELVKLKDILEYVRGQKGSLPENGKLVRIRDLRDDKVEFHLSVSDIENSKLRKSYIHQINESCILLAIRWRTLKPTFFKFEGTPIYRNQDILSFKLDETIADFRYVINELNADYVQEQLETYRTGATIPYLRREDLLEVSIKLPSLQEQKAKIKGIIELSDKIKILQNERNALAHSVSNKLYESVSTIKHSLGKPLLNIGSSLRNIENALSRLNIQWEQIRLNDRHDVTIKDSFESIHSNLEFIHSVLKNNELALEVKNYRLEEIDFLNFIKRYVKKVKSAEKNNVILNLDIHSDVKIQLMNKIMLKANAELLEIALNTIVENAYMHAFIEPSAKYKLLFRVSVYVAASEKSTKSGGTFGRFNTSVKIDVANNGKPFPKNYTVDKLIRKGSFAGETGNTGQGGFDLNEIIKYHNDGKSTLELITDDITSEYTTTYSFLLPLN